MVQKDRKIDITKLCLNKKNVEMKNTKKKLKKEENSNSLSGIENSRRFRAYYHISVAIDVFGACMPLL